MKSAYKYRTNKLLKQEAVCIGTALAIAVFIANLFKTPHSYWIPLTVALMFGTPAQGMIIKKSLHRFVGTTVGLIFCFLFIKTFLYSDYRWLYLIPIPMFILCYLLLVPTAKYACAVFFITFYIALTDVIFGEASMSIDIIFIKRFEFTVIGILITLLCEFVIYKNAALTYRKFKINTQEHFAAISDIILVSTDCFIGKKKITKELISKLNSWLSSKLSIENLDTFLRYELEYEEDKNKLQELVFYKLNRINESIRKLICIINNDYFYNSGITEKEFIEICCLVSEKYKFMTRFYYGRKPKKIKGFSALIEKVKYNNSMSPTYFFLEEIFELNKNLNEYMAIFQSKSLN